MRHEFRNGKPQTAIQRRFGEPPFDSKNTHIKLGLINVIKFQKKDTLDLFSNEITDLDIVSLPTRHNPLVLYLQFCNV